SLPVIITPADGAVLTSPKPIFDWTDVAGATSYTLQVCANNSFSTYLINANPTASTFTPTTSLPVQKVLDVRLRVNGPNGPSPWAYWSFIIIP
ncbi:MAG TPA: hypothetical protein VK449_01870, partial [Anaerolineales bacterium]|nr:hypothetical protein [Anaerolineales bacterium]